MKQSIIALALCAAGILTAQENVLLNGGFEKISKKPKSNAYIMGQVREGWDFGKGPIAKFADGWITNRGKIKSFVVTIGANGENKEHVAEGKTSLHFVGERFSMYNSKNLKPGKYKLSFKYKGSGRITIASYNYYDTPQKKTKIMGPPKPVVVTMAKPQWQTLEKDIEIGLWDPVINRCAISVSGNKVDVYLDDFSLVPIK